MVPNMHWNGTPLSKRKLGKEKRAKPLATGVISKVRTWDDCDHLDVEIRRKFNELFCDPYVRVSHVGNNYGGSLFLTVQRDTPYRNPATGVTATIEKGSQFIVGWTMDRDRPSKVRYEGINACDYTFMVSLEFHSDKDFASKVTEGVEVVYLEWDCVRTYDAHPDEPRTRIYPNLHSLAVNSLGILLAHATNQDGFDGVIVSPEDNSDTYENFGITLENQRDDVVTYIEEGDDDAYHCSECGESLEEDEAFFDVEYQVLCECCRDTLIERELVQYCTYCETYRGVLFSTWLTWADDYGFGEERYVCKPCEERIKRDVLIPKRRHRKKLDGIRIIQVKRTSIRRRMGHAKKLHKAR